MRAADQEDRSPRTDCSSLCREAWVPALMGQASGASAPGMNTSSRAVVPVSRTYPHPALELATYMCLFPSHPNSSFVLYIGSLSPKVGQWL